MERGMVVTFEDVSGLEMFFDPGVEYEAMVPWNDLHVEVYTSAGQPIMVARSRIGIMRENGDGKIDVQF